MIASRLTGVALAALLGAASAARGAAPPKCPQHVDVRNLMTVTQFYAAGLDKLSGAQVAALNQWLRDYVQRLCAAPSVTTQRGSPAVPSTGLGTPAPAARVHTAAPVPASNAIAEFGAPPEPQGTVPTQIESRIIGDFHGWTGDTIFRLENGQIWEQAGPGYFETNLRNPKVKIKKLLIGYVLIVDGYAKEVFVRRIQ